VDLVIEWGQVHALLGKRKKRSIIIVDTM